MKNLFKTITSILLVLLMLVGCSINKIEVNTNQNSTTYVNNEDYQNFLGLYSSSVKADNGYYFISNMVVHYFDNTTKKSYPICNKINCDHSNDKCSAYLSSTNFYSEQLGYYDGNLYVLGWETKQANVHENYLYQISLKDFKRRKATYLFDSSGSASCSFAIHRGFVYYTLGGSVMQDSKAQLCRAKLGSTKKNDKDRAIYEFSGIGAEIFSLSASGNKVYFSTTSYQDEEGNGYKKSLNSVDIHTLESDVIVDDNKYSYFIDRAKIYYQKTKNVINCVDLETNSDEFFCNVDGLCYISADDNFVYFDNLQTLVIDESKTIRKISVLDKNGNFVTEIEPRNPADDCVFGGNDLLIFRGSTEDNKLKYYAIDKNKIQNFDNEFIEMN